LTPGRNNDLEEILVYARRRLRWLVSSGRVWPTRLISNFRHDPVEDPFQKYLAEYALLLMLAHRSGSLDQRSMASVENAALELQLLTSSARGHFRLRASPYASCSTVGFTLTVVETVTGRHDNLTGLLRDRCRVHKHAHYAYATMARHWWLRLLMGLPEEPTHAQERAMLHRLLTATEHPAYMSADQLYEITHVAFFLGDFGRRPVLQPGSVADAGNLLDGALARNLATGDADLLTETVMTQLALQLPLTDYSLEALDYLDHLFASQGLARSTPEDEEVQVRKSSPSETQPYGMLYHLVLVYGMLQAMLAVTPPVAGPSHRRTPPEGLRLAAVGALERASSWLAGTQESREASPSPDRRPPAWWLEHLPPSVRDWLESGGAAPLSSAARSRLVLDAVMIRALLDYDLPALAGALATAADLGLPSSWTEEEMLQALLTQQLPSGAFGGLVDFDGARSFGESTAITAGVVRALRRHVLHPSMSAPVRMG
jgi:hypothetical protein